VAAHLANAGLLDMGLDLPPKRPRPSLAVERGECIQLEACQATNRSGR